MSKLQRGIASMNWLDANKEFVEEHRGQWLLMDGEEVIIVSEKFEDIHVKIKKSNFKDAFVHRIPKDNREYLWI